jgi:hypothetical protein
VGEYWEDRLGVGMSWGLGRSGVVGDDNGLAQPKCRLLASRCQLNDGWFRPGLAFVARALHFVLQLALRVS